VPLIVGILVAAFLGDLVRAVTPVLVIAFAARFSIPQLFEAAGLREALRGALRAVLLLAFRVDFFGDLDFSARGISISLNVNTLR
jgi:hypothetical protein